MLCYQHKVTGTGTDAPGEISIIFFFLSLPSKETDPGPRLRPFFCRDMGGHGRIGIENAPLGGTMGGNSSLDTRTSHPPITAHTYFFRAGPMDVAREAL